MARGTGCASKTLWVLRVSGHSYLHGSFSSSTAWNIDSIASQFGGVALGQESSHALAVTWQVSPGSGGEFPRGPSELQVGLLDCESWSAEKQLPGGRGSDWAGAV